MSLPESSERDRRELELLVALGASAMAVRGYTAPESDRIGQRVRELCHRLKPSSTAALALFGLGQVLTVQARHSEAHAVSRDVLATGRAIDDSGVEMVGHYGLGYLGVWMGNLSAGWRNLQRACQLYDADEHAWLTHALGMALGPEAFVWGAVCGLHCGWFEQAFGMAEEGIAVARKLEHPFTLCHTLGIGGSALRIMAGDYETANRFAEEAAAIAEREHFPFWVWSLAIQRGVIEGYLGHPGEGASTVRSGLDAWHEMGVHSFRGWFYSYVADLERMQGRPDLGLEIVERELENVQKTEEGLSEQYLILQRGKLEGALGHTSLAIQGLEESIANARRIGSHLLELQSATALAEIHLQEQRSDDAANILQPVLSQFTEGLATPHLITARSVLARL
jgi:tetratricopeptide (TPR) repeat protein